MNVEALTLGLEKYHTPLYIFNIDEMQATITKFREALHGVANLCFAIKANPFLVDAMAPVVDRIEVCSTGEFRICKARQIPAEKILISGVLKKREDIREILDYYRGTCYYTAESYNQFMMLAEWADEHQEMIRVFPRLCGGSQFGMDPSVLCEIIAHRQDYPYIHIQGIHYFTGTQKKKVDKIRQEIAYLDEFFETLEKDYGYVPEELEYGPGLAVPYFEGQKDLREEDLSAVAEIMGSMKWQGAITLEMGRALAAEGGYYLTSVLDLKTNEDKNYCIVDGGLHQLNYDGQIRGMYKPFFKTIPEQEGETKTWTVCGALCTTNDILMQKVEISHLQMHSVLVFERVGAYAMTEGMSIFLSHSLPSVALYSARDGYRLVRDRIETYELNMIKEN